MKKTAFGILAAFSIILAALLLAYPDILLNPGPLMKGHRYLKRECLSCHTPFRGVRAVQCVGCHRPENIGIRTVAGRPLNRDLTGATLHRGLPAASCIECHTDHKGADDRKAIRAFRHEAISASLRNNCNACHERQKPNDALHRSDTGRCAQCHDTQRWSSVLFNHSMLDAKQSANCTSCHRDDKPGDDIHRSQSSCGECHGTNRWRPATFDHDRYFPLQGEHWASCRTCHADPADYRKYTCYGCHEHSPSRIASEHREEGIGNYQNCIRCHRSGSKHGGEHGRLDRRHDDDD